MDELEFSDDLFYLIRLQMANQVPVNFIRHMWWHKLLFVERILDAIFAELGDSRSKGFFDRVDADVLRHGDESHRRRSESLSYASQISSHTHAFLNGLELQHRSRQTRIL